LPEVSCGIVFLEPESFSPRSGPEQLNRIAEVNHMKDSDRIRGAKLLKYPMFKDIRI